jgi:hypothetical protein
VRDPLTLRLLGLIGWWLFHQLRLRPFAPALATFRVEGEVEGVLRLKQAKQVWKWALETGKGKSWLYYIAAVCQWLPTNYRMNYNRDISQRYCNLCLGSSLDTMDHLLRCPALAKEQVHLKERVVSKFDYWDIPYASIPQKPREHILRAHWRSVARQKFSSTVISDLRLDLLTKGFYKENSQKHFISTRSFTDSLSKILSIPRTSSYQLRQTWCLC